VASSGLSADLRWTSHHRILDCPCLKARRSPSGIILRTDGGLLQFPITEHSAWLKVAPECDSRVSVMRRDMYDVASSRRQGLNVSSTSFRRFSDRKCLLRKGRQDGYSVPPQDLLLGLLLPLWRSPATSCAQFACASMPSCPSGDRSPIPQNLLGDASAGERACHRSIVRGRVDQRELWPCVMASGSRKPQEFIHRNSPFDGVGGRH
jgi:hypothetical protein